MAPGAKASKIALRHGLHRNQLYEWRRQFCSVADAAAGLVASDFVPLVAEDHGGSGAAAIEIEIGGATLRVGAGIELGFLGKVLPVEGHEMIPALALSGAPPAGCGC